MLVHIINKSLLRLLVAGSCSAILTFAALTMESSAETITIRFTPSTEPSIRSTSSITPDNSNSTSSITPDNSNSTPTTTSGAAQLGNCLYASQLATDPALRAAFMVNARNAPPETEDSEIYESDIEARVKDSGYYNSRTDIDSFSNGCLACHDGVMAQDFKLRVKNNPRGRAMTLEDITGGHPVGMDYETYMAANNGTYNSTVSFPKEMIFADGKIGCLTCHNPLNDKKGHLVMTNEKSELCFACHSK